MCVKIFAFGLRGYLSYRNNIFDGFLTILLLVRLPCAPVFDPVSRQYKTSMMYYHNNVIIIWYWFNLLYSSFQYSHVFIFLHQVLQITIYATYWLSYSQQWVFNFLLLYDECFYVQMQFFVSHAIIVLYWKFYCDDIKMNF